MTDTEREYHFNDPDAMRKAGLGHLLEDAPSRRCDTCGRRSYSPAAWVFACGMRQPDGTKCPGRFA